MAIVGVVIGVVQVPIHQVLVEAMAEEVEDYNGKTFTYERLPKNVEELKALSDFT